MYFKFVHHKGLNAFTDVPKRDLKDVLNNKNFLGISGFNHELKGVNYVLKNSGRD